MSKVRERILILGGTEEARREAERRKAAGHEVITSLAGRTSSPLATSGEIRTGGFGGAEGLAAYIRDTAIDRVIDATHPFALQISRNAEEATNVTGVPLEIMVREPWTSQEGDKWNCVASIQNAVKAVPENSRAFLALGHQHIAPFSVRPDVHFVVRMVDDRPLPISNATLITGHPEPNPAAEAALFKAHAINHLVCRNSGGTKSYGKLIAARQLGLTVTMIERGNQDDESS